MRCLRTPEDRFEDLPGWPWEPRYVDDLPGLEGVQVHYVDEGRGVHGMALCLHGNPAWSYLYRHMIPVFLRAGLRVVAPDLPGFGRSDKPVDESDHRFLLHRRMLLDFVERLDLTRITLVCQDWGGILGLTLPHAMPERFDRLLVMNTTLGTGEPPGEGFVQWRDYVRRTPDLSAGRLLARGKPELTAAEQLAYDAPFPDARHKAAVRAFPEMVPVRPDAEGAAESRDAAAFLGTRWQGDTFMAIGMRDPVLGPPVMRALAARIRDCRPPMEVAEAGHFVQEWGEPIARAAMEAFDLSGH
jgi:pimeloyl-ACP methyl ester carboxylesterase